MVRTMDDPAVVAIRERVAAAAASGTALRLRGGGSKDFLGRRAVGEPVELGGLRGVVSYEPTELVITARAGTPLAEIEQVLAESGQMLAFEPPRLGAGATIGGTIAAGLSGPRRPWYGAARDHVLGTRIVNGRGELLAFGGQVMKNVAGYDLSRLMAGAMGTLGILVEVSLKVLPRPAETVTLVQEASAAEAIERLARWSGQPLPLSGAVHVDGRLHVRLSGTPGGVAAAVAKIGGEGDGDQFFDAWRELDHPFFAPTDGGDTDQLWRISVPPAAAPLEVARGDGGQWAVDWGGALRWWRPREACSEQAVRAAVSAAGGHATLLRGGDPDGEVFHPLAPGILALHRRVKAALDPAGVLNPGRMYSDL
ncbi:MAG: glycolate oxidase subunit GlcE [Ectothiorhodospiraceae bacterium]|nr:glycolate oxidase subunit GlcE [Chromatiales bacterium]MCP5156033.1 glycolate oxidase subunit GlcE [Ectothiorhodospiraceae bacterium]